MEKLPSNRGESVELLSSSLRDTGLTGHIVKGATLDSAVEEFGKRSAPEVSIVICTLDRQDELSRAIHSILEQDIDPSRYEIIVVDNGSRDQTREVVAEIQNGVPHVRYVLESKLGLSIARNRGTLESRAPLIAFFDDDGTADPGWLTTILQVFRDDPSAGAAGGVIRVAWPSERPEWMPEDLLGYYGRCDYGDTRRPLTFPEYPYGPNMLIRCEHLMAIGGFREEVGPIGQNIMSGDELDVFQRLSELPIKVVYEPAAVVRHWVPHERVTRKWLLRRAYKHGFSSTRLAHARADATRLTWVRLLARATYKSALACVSGTLGVLNRVDTSVMTSRYAHMAYWAGVARGATDGIACGKSYARSSDKAPTSHHDMAASHFGVSEVSIGVPEVSIVIGTLDRCDMLARALRSLLEQGCDPQRYEIVVVDNGSKDRTREVVAEFQKRAENVRYVVEPQLGLSRARNRGIAESRAPLISFFDDDGSAEPGWLETMLEVFRNEPDAAAAGGPIRVAWPNEQPSWMPMELHGYYAGCDYGPTRRYLAYPEYPYGPNMMIRRSLLEAIGGFNAAVGPQGQNIMSAGEQDLFQRLYQQPIKVVYEPNAVVHHWVPPERATRKWLLRRAYKHGISHTRTTTTRANRTRVRWLQLFLLASLRGMMATLSGGLGSLGLRDSRIVTARFAYMSYWFGVARGALDGVMYG